jgi:hypothetical protein
LGLGLGKVVVGELFHQAQDGVKGASVLSSGLAQRPQPGDVDVGVAGGDDVHIQGRTGLGDTLSQSSVGRGYAGIEPVAEGVAGIQYLECLI